MLLALSYAIPNYCYVWWKLTDWWHCIKIRTQQETRVNHSLVVMFFVISHKLITIYFFHKVLLMIWNMGTSHDLKSGEAWNKTEKKEFPFKKLSKDLSHDPRPFWRTPTPVWCAITAYEQLLRQSVLFFLQMLMRSVRFHQAEDDRSTLQMHTSLPSFQCNNTCRAWWGGWAWERRTHTHKSNERKVQQKHCNAASLYLCSKTAHAVDIQRSQMPKTVVTPWGIYIKVFFWLSRLISLAHKSEQTMVLTDGWFIFACTFSS